MRRNHEDSTMQGLERYAKTMHNLDSAGAGAIGIVTDIIPGASLTKNIAHLTSGLIGHFKGHSKQLREKFEAAIRTDALAFDTEYRFEFRTISEADKRSLRELIVDQLSSTSHEALGMALLGADEFSVFLEFELYEMLMRTHDWTTDKNKYVIAFSQYCHQSIYKIIHTQGLFETATVQDLRILSHEINAIRRSNKDLNTKYKEVLAKIEAITNDEIKQHPIIAGTRPRVTAHFQARGEMATLTKAFETDGVVPLCALKGMRGVGKTQILAKYAEKCIEEGWKFVGWVTASTRQQAVIELAEIARTAEISSEEIPEKAVNDLKVWLQSREDINKLLVFDNVNDIEEFNDLFPSGKRLQVLITTTQQTMTPGISVSVGVYSLEQSLAYLATATGINNNDAATQVANDLGRLPVALSQAANFIRHSDYTYSEYRKLLAEYPLAENMEQDKGESYNEKVDAALRITYNAAVEQIDGSESSDLAYQTLAVLSLLAEEGVPRRWLYDASTQSREIRQVIGKLVHRGVITESEDRVYISLHRLQSQVIWEDLRNQKKILPFTGIAALILSSISISPSMHYEAKKQLLIQLTNQLTAIANQPRSQSLLINPLFLGVVKGTVGFSYELKYPYQAIRLAPYLAQFSEVFGSENAETLSLQNLLAAAYKFIGDINQAIALYDNTLTVRLKNLDPKVPDIFAAMSDLAGAYKAKGDLFQAIPLYEQAVAGLSSLLPIDHREILAAKNNLAVAYRSAGNYEQSIPLHREVLQGYLDTLGSEHEETLISKVNLASALDSKGRVCQEMTLISEARLLSEEAVCGLLKSLGPDHPATLVAQNCQASVYHSAGDLERATSLYQKTLDKQQEDPDFRLPDALITQANLADAYLSQGNAEEAIQLYEETLESSKRTHGEKHSSTLSVRISLAEAYLAAKNFGRAADIFEEGLALFTAETSPDNPEIIHTQELISQLRAKDTN